MKFSKVITLPALAGSLARPPNFQPPPQKNQTPRGEKQGWEEQPGKKGLD
ncbi:MAG: hypothetical protein IPG48_10505 [Saprospiraceae bacterium]|nr:hypothetical protein [Saprospiraceae bacterium]